MTSWQIIAESAHLRPTASMRRAISSEDLARSLRSPQDLAMAPMQGPKGKLVEGKPPSRHGSACGSSDERGAYGDWGESSGQGRAEDFRADDEAPLAARLPRRAFSQRSRIPPAVCRRRRARLSRTCVDGRIGSK